MRRRARADPVTPEIRGYVLRRDGGCVAALLEPGHVCRDRWGYPWAATYDLTLDHIKKEPGMGFRSEKDPETGVRTSDARWLVTLCWGAHLGGWATAHRPELREYLARKEGAA